MRSTFKILFYVKEGCEKSSGNLPLTTPLKIVVFNTDYRDL